LLQKSRLQLRTKFARLRSSLPPYPVQVPSAGLQGCSQDANANLSCYAIEVTDLV